MGDALLPTTTGECTCPNCVVGAYFQSNAYDNGYQNYGYGLNNSLQFQSMSAFPDVVCVSHIDLMFAYGPSMCRDDKGRRRRRRRRVCRRRREEGLMMFPAHYFISDISPRTGAYSGMTTVTVYGDNFEEASNPVCSYVTTPPLSCYHTQYK